MSLVSVVSDVIVPESTMNGDGTWYFFGLYSVQPASHWSSRSSAGSNAPTYDVGVKKGSVSRGLVKSEPDAAGDPTAGRGSGDVRLNGSISPALSAGV